VDRLRKRYHSTLFYWVPSVLPHHGSKVTPHSCLQVTLFEYEFLSTEMLWHPCSIMFDRSKIIYMPICNLANKSGQKKKSMYSLCPPFWKFYHCSTSVNLKWLDRKTMKIPNPDSWCQSEDLNWTAPKYKLGVTICANFLGLILGTFLACLFQQNMECLFSTTKSFFTLIPFRASISTKQQYNPI
jgi:hypothetical protein